MPKRTNIRLQEIVEQIERTTKQIESIGRRNDVSVKANRFILRVMNSLSDIRFYVKCNLINY